MKKRLLQVVLISASMFLFSFTSVPQNATAATSYTDIKEGAWYYSAISNLHNKDIAFGYNNSNQYRPNQAANRGETAQFIVNALNLDTSNVQDPGFTDVPKSHPYYKAIAVLANEKIINGVGNNKYNPSGNLERVQIANIITKSFSLEMSSATKSKFEDVNTFAERTKNPNYIKYVETLVDYGIASGVTLTSYAPSKSVTRAELAMFLNKTLIVTDTDTDFDVVEVE